MLQITLLRALYHEMDPEKIPGVREYEGERGSKYHEMELEVPGYPEFHTLTVKLEYLIYNATHFCVYMNGNLDKNEEIDTPVINAAITCFFKRYKPELFLEDLPEDLSGRSILDCLDVAKVSDYRPTFAFPGLVLLEDIRNGTAKMPDLSKPTFPGLRMFTKHTEEEPEEDRPVCITSDQEYIKFEGEADFSNKMEELKKKFSMDGLEDMQKK